MNVLKEAKYLSLCELTFTHPHSKQVHQWEVCQRMPPCSNIQGVRVDAVDIYATWKDGSTMILVKQFRPALMTHTIEFPSGLVDVQDEGNVTMAAHRELLEETGYTAMPHAVHHMSPPLAYEPGMTNSGTRVVHLVVDPQDVCNAHAMHHVPTDRDEAGMRTLLVPHSSAMLPTLHQLVQDDPSTVIDSRVYAYALGLASTARQ